MIKHEVEQGTPEWFAARLGIPTASEFDKIIKPTGGASKSADGYADQLLAEMMVGDTVETFDGSAWTQRGKELEPQAVLFYEQRQSIDCEAVGFCTDDDRTMGCSPDRFVGDDGLLEIKVPAPKTHVGYMLYKSIDREYYPQIMGQMLVTGRKWVDLLSYHPVMKPVIIRVERDEDYIAEMADLIAQFTAKLAKKKAILIEKGYMS